MKRAALLLLGLIVSASSAAAQRTAGPEAAVLRALRADDIWSPLRLLSDDLFEGRGTGARGGELAARYLAAQFMRMGLEPAGDAGTWYHNVPIVTLVPDATLRIAAAGSGAVGAAAPAWRFRDDFVLWSERAPDRPPDGAPAPVQTIAAEGDVVFVGFGISAPEWQWDDYRGLDVRGKILLMLVNDPGLRDPSIFRGPVLTYYGRWTYKLEEAARRGAAGVLLVHNDTMATYGWNTVRNSWTGDQVRLITPPTSLAFGGWITQRAAADLLAAGGHDLDRLMRAAGRRDFRPVATGVSVRGEVRSAVRFSQAPNVVARFAGSDSSLRHEAVVVTAHYDHLGLAQPVAGDSIMNGAVDNASGTATMLAVADAFARSGVRPRRSLVFVAFTGEEKGLLGSQAFAERAPMPLRDIAAVLNIDVTNLYAPTRDIAALGVDQSSLGRLFEQAARAEGLRVVEDRDALLRGSFFRSDHFPLAKAGVPALSWEMGEDAIGHPAGWMREQRAIYNRERYHQPTDEVLPAYVLDGTIQQARVLIRVALLAGNAASQPAWNASSEFRAAGEARRRN